MARRLAAVFDTGPWQPGELDERTRSALTGRRRWLSGLLRRVWERFDSGVSPGHRQLVDFLLHDQGFLTAFARHMVQLADQPLGPAMWPLHGRPAMWEVPALATPGDLASWLGLDLGSLDWLADVRHLEAKVSSERLRNYRYHWCAKPHGTPRLIEAPKPRLMAAQRRILHEILDRIPPHDAAHGFRTGRSVRSFVAPHVYQRVVLRMDLRDFFPSIAAARAEGIFLTAGYPPSVARLLTGLCTNVVPTDVLSHVSGVPSGPPTWRLEALYRRPHLPQGAATSPALANLCAFRLDCRLAGLAKAAGARYTRYADDLVFSGGDAFQRVVERFYLHAGATAGEEGFRVHTRKTRIMRSSTRQKAAGIVLNEHANIARPDYDRLKATLYNCVRHGPASQNVDGHPCFREHLAGKVAYVTSINPARGERLRALFERIAW